MQSNFGKTTALRPLERESRRGVEPAKVMDTSNDNRLSKKPNTLKNMNWDQVKGNWKQTKGKAKEKWGKLTDDDLDVAEGKRDQLVGKVQERYGCAREEAEREVDEFANSL